MKSVEFIGNVGRVPTKKTTKEGKEFVEFSVAINERDGAVFWVSCIMNGDTKISPFLVKGKQVFIRGPFSLSVYDGKPSLTVTAKEIHLLGGGEKGSVVDRK